jgi:hypothetical protein
LDLSPAFRFSLGEAIQGAKHGQGLLLANLVAHAGFQGRQQQVVDFAVVAAVFELHLQGAKQGR